MTPQLQQQAQSTLRYVRFANWVLQSDVNALCRSYSRCNDDWAFRLSVRGVSVGQSLAQ